MRALASVSPIHSFFFWGGWSALVAIGTLSLAFATYSLVRASKRLALNADAELRAQWRPRWRALEHAACCATSVRRPDPAPSEGMDAQPG